MDKQRRIKHLLKQPLRRVSSERDVIVTQRDGVQSVCVSQAMILTHVLLVALRVDYRAIVSGPV